MILRCTKKLLDVIRSEQVTAPEPDLEDWYANLLYFDRRKCLLLTHVGTLFTIFEADVRASDLRATHALVTRVIERELLAENLPADAFGDLGTEDLLISKTSDRSVLGSMNDMALHCQVSIANAGSLGLVDLAALNRGLHRNINSSRDFERPIDLVIARSNG